MINEALSSEKFESHFERLLDETEVRLKSHIHSPHSTPTDEELSQFIDLTLLKADATEKQIQELCQLAMKSHFKTVCVNPRFVSLCHKELGSSSVKIATVIGFPLGATTTNTKVFEAKNALENGAKELDMVIAIGALKDENYFYVYHDIQAVVRAVLPWPVKVIIETCLLTREQKIQATLLVQMANAAFVKTSTGFSSSGATEEDVQLLRAIVGPTMGVKASGGIRTKDAIQKMVVAGATRIGTSNGDY